MKTIMKSKVKIKDKESEELFTTEISGNIITFPIRLLKLGFFLKSNDMELVDVT